MIRAAPKGRSEVKDLNPSTEPDLKAKSPSDRLRWAIQSFPEKVVLTTSFGAQSAAFLHWASKISPAIPIIFIDTGYHFPETLAFASELTARLGLNLKTYRPRLTPTQIESKHGLLWQEGPSGLEKFHEIIRVEPLQRALSELNPSVWVAGLRGSSSLSRQSLDILVRKKSRYKLLPILEWTDRDLGLYLKEHSLPYHPLWAQGYISIGDSVTTKRLDEVSDPAELRHNGWKRECGIHEKV
jgi:phosphoadenosine phosphosulfate reductase